MKKKILVWCDGPSIPTGFGIVAKNLLKNLHKEFEVRILAINYHGLQKYDTDKYFCYTIDRQDILGLKRLPMILEDYRPDLIFGFQDIFHLDMFLPIVKDRVPAAKNVVYFPIDGSPVSPFWEAVLKEPDACITYTNWAKKVLSERFPNYKNKIETMYHGIDTKVFKPLDEKTTRILSRSYGWFNKFSVVNINRFQPRKFVDGANRAFYLFYQGYKICQCGNYYPSNMSYCDLNFCGQKNVIKVCPGHKDVVLYLHMQPQEFAMGPGKANTLQGHLLNTGFTNDDLKAGVIQINTKTIYDGKTTDEDINGFYNAACLNISSALGEGFGFSLAEAAATGTTSIAGYNSAIPEVLGDTGYLIPNQAHITLPGDNGHMRPVVHIGKMTEALELEYDKWQKNDRRKVFNQAALDRVNDKFLWDDKREYLANVFRKVLGGTDE